MHRVAQMRQAIEAIFVEANRLARQTGFVKREREGKLTGKRFAVTMIFGLLARGEASLSELSSFARHTGMSISTQGLDDRFSEQAAAFMEQLLNIAFTQVVAADEVAIPLLQRFREVVVEDSSTFRLPDELAERWPGSGGGARGASRGVGTQAALKIQVCWELLHGGLVGLGMQAGRTPDSRSVLKGRPRVAKGVRIHDLGYFDTAEFAADEAAGAYFVSRYKSGVKLFDEQGQELDLPTVLSQHASAQPYECRVQVSATRHVPARLIAIAVPEEEAVKRQSVQQRKAQKHGRQPSASAVQLCHWTIILTNIPPAELSIAEALVLLRLRWQIELLFKLWKQLGQADVSRSAQPWHVLCDLYAKLLGLVIMHWLLIVSCWHIPSRSMVKAAKAMRADSVLIARALAGKGELEEVLAEIVSGLEGCRMNSRRKAPNTYQYLLAPSALVVSATKPSMDELLT